MKKLMAFGLVACAALFAKADVQWSWWMEHSLSRPDLSFGLASKCQSVCIFVNFDPSIFD